ncbi:agmatinase [Paenochrobactrum gallinarii]|uniref:Agmatinase n=1 Tax=Paenochrobactrum gallinarii TaxID=643673 RepID=A0A841M0E1_9HYPH|nr:agmatinase family protein [Paenochrobactrum gallinarii]MBB6262217.1 agmatinase [Paenochrobactrum gallinarii]
MTNEAFENPRLVKLIYGDTPSFMATQYCPDMTDVKADVAIVGMPYDGIATLRGGATRLAPSSVRKLSLLYGSYNFDWDLEVFNHIHVVDAGDTDIVPGNNVESYQRLQAKISGIKKSGAIPFMIGGDHGVSYPAVKEAVCDIDYQAGMVIFDTHLDLAESYREDRLTRASPLKRICELPNIDPRKVCIIGARGPRNVKEWTPIAEELGIRLYTMSEVNKRGIHAVAEEALLIASPDGKAPYISFDIDGVDPAFAPATNSIEPGGLTSLEAIDAVRIVCENGLLGFDVVEVAPEHDNASQITSALAARLMAEAFATLAARKIGCGRKWEYNEVK